MRLIRASTGWALVGAGLGLLAAFVAHMFMARFGMGMGVVSTLVTVLLCSASAGVGAAIGWLLDRADSRGRGCMAPFLALVAAGVLVSVVAPIIIGDVVSRATGDAVSEARRRAEDAIRNRRAPTGGDAWESVTNIARRTAPLILAPSVGLVCLVIAPVAALGTSRRRR